MALSDDPINRARGHVDYVTDELGEHTEVIIEVTIEGAQWETIKGSSEEAAAFVSWLAENVAE
jgi:hypothetical protein